MGLPVTFGKCYVMSSWG